jgi:hypothetical protein
VTVIPSKPQFFGQDRELNEVVHLALLPARVVHVRVGIAGVEPGAIGVHEFQGVDLVAERGHGLGTSK